ncbi:Arc family DNA-binding protein [Propioniciclava sp.]|jgi:plasmid stability protein|uniref:FitA-like ribbon-helix-helix domain-containing protein n=1 Tax=Propioniciclava sp. TaxID=2038686 RepID=UPI0026244EF5|nr:Arc family DNA-binding protein [Propioniciclava sp.]
MTAITIRKLPDETKQKLRLRAAAHGRSMEAEARDILVTSLNQPAGADISWIQQLVELGRSVGGVDLPIDPRDAARAAEL